MALVRSTFGTQFSQKQGQITRTTRGAYLEGSSVALKGRHRGKTTKEGKNIHKKLKQH